MTHMCRSFYRLNVTRGLCCWALGARAGTTSTRTWFSIVVYPGLPPEDEVFLVEEQPLPAAISPTADSPGYVDEEEEEAHPAPAPMSRGACICFQHATTYRIMGLLLEMGSADRLPTVSPPSPVSPPPLPASPTYPLGYRVAMIWLRAEAPSTSHPLPLPSPIVLPRTRACMAMLRADAPSTYILAPRSEAPPSGTPPLLPIPLPTPSPPLLLPSTDRRADVHEACLPPRKRLCFAFGPRYKVGESSLTARPDRDFRRDYGFIATLDDEIMRDPERDVGYGIINTWDEMLVGMPRVPMIDETELGRQVTDLVTTVRHDTDKIYERLDDAQTKRQMVTNRGQHVGGSRAVRDHRVAGSRPQETDIVDRGPKIDKDAKDIVDKALQEFDMDRLRLPAQPDAPPRRRRIGYSS
ncbi:hypothetical protein Tco_0923980 [Tanacetum coccineum]|uniref:Uncharacterized protein n=1 Tax=Tanacetum coccineum TaxID=301880 RepID=A0ABQ5D2I0_9ASTR